MATAINEEIAALWNGTTIFLASVAGTNTITAAATPPLDAYAKGQRYEFYPDNDNTGAVTLNIDSRGAKNIVDEEGDPLDDGVLRADRKAAVIYDGIHFVIDRYQSTKEKGQINGYASLDSVGRVPIAQLPTAILGSITFKGTWDADANDPTIPAASAGNSGWFYIVGVEGTTTIDGISSWSVGDWIISNGTVWEKIPSFIAFATEEEALDFYFLEQNPGDPVGLKVPNLLRVHQMLKSFEPLDPTKWFGAIGDGDENNAPADSAALIDLFDGMAEASAALSANLPSDSWPTPAGGRKFYDLIGRRVDLRGKTFRIEGAGVPVDVGKIYGLRLQNGSLIPVDDSNWDDGGGGKKPVLQFATTAGSDYAPAETFGAWLDNITVGCVDQAGVALCNGIKVVSGCRGMRITRSHVWGYDAIDDGYGIYIAGGIEHEINWNKLYGPNRMATAAPVTPNSATGLLFLGGDSEIVGNKVFRSKVGIDIRGAGVQAKLNHTHGFSDDGENPAMRIEKASTAFVHVHTNYFDSGYLEIINPRNVSIIGNHWVCNQISSQPAITVLIRLIAESAGETLQDFTCVNNSALVPTQLSAAPPGLFDRPIEFVEEGGNSWGDIRYARIGDNLFKSASSAPSGTWQGGTFGKLITDVVEADFDGGLTVAIDLSDTLAIPAAETAKFVASVQGVRGSARLTPTHAAYSRLTQKLYLTFATAGDTRIIADYEWGEQGRVLDSALIEAAEEPDDILGAKLKAWWAADDHGTANMTDDGSGLISNWVDRIGAMALTATAGARPTWTADGFADAFAGLTFDGVADCMVSTSLGTLPTGSTAGEIWVIFRSLDTDVESDRIVAYGGDSGATSRQITLLSSNHDAPRAGDGVSFNGNNVTGSLDPCIVGALYKATTVSGWVNASDMDNDGTIASLNTGTTRMRIGARNLSAADAFAKCVISDVLITTELTDDERDALRSWAAHARGVAL